MTTTRAVLSVAALLAVLGVARDAGAQEPAAVTSEAIGVWSGPFRSMQLSSGPRYSGNVRIVPAPGRPVGTLRVDLRLISPGATGFLEWGVSPGRCGTMIQLVVHPRELPQLNLRSGGNAEVTYDGVMALKPDTAYQLVIFKDGANQQNIVACANLKYDLLRD